MKLIPKKFSLHPSIVKSIINEQAGEVVKAIAELIMNSIDAGATRVDMEINANGLKISDDGRGFNSVDQIESFFGTFGTPHAQSSDAVYGQFRIGRGQLFAIAKSEWRSGHFSMNVDLEGSDEQCYELAEHDHSVTGCTITAQFYQPLNIHEGVQNVEIFESNLDKKLSQLSKTKNVMKLANSHDFASKLITFFAMVETPIFINGHQISSLVKPTLIKETDVAYFYESTANNTLTRYNKGIFISAEFAEDAMIIDYKKSPVLNMARNQINRNCNTYIQSEKDRAQICIDQVMAGRDSKQLNELPNLMFHSSKSTSLYLETLFSLINADNLPYVLNAIKATIYYDHELKTIGLYDLHELYQTAPDMFVFNDIRQMHIFDMLNKATIRNFLNDTIDDTYIVVDAPLFSQTKRLLTLMQFVKSKNPDLNFNWIVQRHQIFNSESDFKGHQIKRKVSVKSNAVKVDQIADSEIAELVRLEKLKFDTKKGEKLNASYKDHLCQGTAELIDLIKSIADEESVQLPSDIVLTAPQVRCIIGSRSQGYGFTHNGIVYLILNERFFDNTYHDFFSKKVLELLFKTIAELDEVGGQYDNQIYDRFQSNKELSDLFMQFHQYDFFHRVSQIDGAIQKVMPSIPLKREEKTKIKKIREAKAVLLGLNPNLYASIEAESAQFNTIGL